MALHAKVPLNPEPKKAKAAKAYPPNVVTFSFPQIALCDHPSFLNIGGEYERFLDRRGHFSLSAAINTGILFGKNVGTNVHGDDLFFAAGARFHVDGNAQKLDFSFGLQAVKGKLSTHEGRYNNDERFIAMLLQSDVDLHASKHGVLGMHLAFGPYFGDVTKSDVATNGGVMIQLGLKIGGRF